MGRNELQAREGIDTQLISPFSFAVVLSRNELQAREGIDTWQQLQFYRSILDVCRNELQAREGIVTIYVVTSY